MVAFSSPMVATSRSVMLGNVSGRERLLKFQQQARQRRPAVEWRTGDLNGKSRSVVPAPTAAIPTTRNWMVLKSRRCSYSRTPRSENGFRITTEARCSTDCCRGANMTGLVLQPHNAPGCRSNCGSERRECQARQVNRRAGIPRIQCDDHCRLFRLAGTASLG